MAMIPFSLPQWVRHSWFEYGGASDLSEEFYNEVRNGLRRFEVEEPVVSIVIPAWNEERTIARTLHSLSRLQPLFPTELIIVNNNSTDRTQEILDRCGARSVVELRRGVAFARQTGLMAARGSYVLCGDADSVYPSSWVDGMIGVLTAPGVALVWGQHSFIPDRQQGRVRFAFYEILKQTLYQIRNRRRPHLNAMGANVGYRRDWALGVGGYDISLRHGEDGKLAMQLSTKGSIQGSSSRRVRVWTSARRFRDDVSLLDSLAKRLRKEVPRLREYLMPGNA